MDRQMTGTFVEVTESIFLILIFCNKFLYIIAHILKLLEKSGVDPQIGK
jgi:hypothetical protein